MLGDEGAVRSCGEESPWAQPFHKHCQEAFALFPADMSEKRSTPDQVVLVIGN
jgi:hypothetical protein